MTTLTFIVGIAFGMTILWSLYEFFKKEPTQNPKQSSLSIFAKKSQGKVTARTDAELAELEEKKQKEKGWETPLSQI